MGASVFLVLSAPLSASVGLLEAEDDSSPLLALPSVVDFLVESVLGDDLLGSGVGWQPIITHAKAKPISNGRLERFRQMRRAMEIIEE